MYYESAIEILKQITFIGALLGGFSLAFLIGLFQLPTTGKLYQASIITIAFTTCCLVLSAVSGSSGIFWLAERPALIEADSIINFPEYLLSYRWSASFLLLGVTGLLATLGLSGWLKSKKLGTWSTAIALVTFILLIYFLVFLMNID